jgi:type 1 glutamine amidotransferase
MRKLLTAVAAAALAFGGFVSAQNNSAEKPKPIKALLVLGGCCHDYARQKDILAKGIAQRANVEVTIAYDPDKTTKHLNPVYANDDWYKGFDVVIHDECTADEKDEAVIEKILKPHKDGLPGVVLHCGMHCYRSKGFPKSTPWFDFTGLPTTAHGAQLPIAISFTDKQSPITKGMEDWTTIKEELYNNVAGGVLPTAKPLAKGKQVSKGRDGKERTDETVIIWTNEYNAKAKVFATTLGHNNETVADPRYLDLVTRGLLWSTGHLTDDGKPAAGYEAPKK